MDKKFLIESSVDVINEMPVWSLILQCKYSIMKSEDEALRRKKPHKTSHRINESGCMSKEVLPPQSFLGEGPILLPRHRTSMWSCSEAQGRAERVFNQIAMAQNESVRFGDFDAHKNTSCRMSDFRGTRYQGCLYTSRVGCPHSIPLGPTCLYARNISWKSLSR